MCMPKVEADTQVSYNVNRGAKNLMKKLPITLIILGIFLFIISPVERTLAQERPFTFEPAPCPYEGTDFGLVVISPEDSGFECGYVTVPERHENPDGPTIRLPVSILRASGLITKPDPIFLAQGGPGGSAFEIFSLTVPNTDIAQERDLVIFNQRGTPFTEPDLTCTENYELLPELLPLSVAEAEGREYEGLTACYERLVQEGVDLSAYNSVQNAADVDAIRQALGYDEINFYGVSYGTLLGLHLMRDYPDNLRTVILDSVVPTDLNFLELTPQNENRTYDLLFEFCNSDPTCSELYPNLEERTFAVIADLNENPVTIPVRDTETNTTHDTWINGDGLMDIFFQAFYIGDMYAMFPKIIHDLEAGDTFFLQELLSFIISDRSFSEGMYYSVICSEDADIDPAAADLTGLRPQIADGAEGDLGSYLEACDIWQVDTLDDFVDDPVTTDIPTLLLSGQYDPITPPSFAEVADASLPNAYNIVDPYATHGVAFEHECIDQVVNDFLNNPNQAPNTRCLDLLTPTDVIPPNVATVPSLAKLAIFDRAYLIQTGIAAVLLLTVLSAYLIWFVSWLINLGKTDKPERSTEEKRIGWISKLLVLSFGALAVIFVMALTGFVADVLFSNITYLTLYVLPATAKPFLAIPFVLLLLAIGILIITVFVWRNQSKSVWSKLYYSLVAICAVSYVAILGIHGFLF